MVVYVEFFSCLIIKEGNVSSKFILVYFDSVNLKVVNKQNKISCAF
jgi:hypothetical protein